MKIALRVENYYELYDMEITNPTADVEPYPHTGTEEEQDDWWNEEIQPLTGAGHPDGDSFYSVEVTGCDDPELIGLEREFG